MRNQRTKIVVWLVAFVVAAFPACSQIVRIEFTSQVTKVTGSPLVGVTVGSIITGHAEVDLAQLPVDEDPLEGVSFYPYSSDAGGRAGFTLEFNTGFERISYDSINAANDPGLASGIYIRDDVAAHDWLTLQARDQGGAHGSLLSFEVYTEPRTLMSGDFFPESVNLQAGLEKARFQYWDYLGKNAVEAIITAASMTIEPENSISALLAQRINASDLFDRRKRELIRLLEASDVALAQGQCKEAFRSLRVFQNVVQAQIGRIDPTLARRLISGAQTMINAGCPVEN